MNYIEQNIYIKEKSGKGKTLYASRNIKKDEVIMEISGPIVKKPTIFTIPVDYDLFIDPVSVENPAKYLCHDCEPSAGIQNKTLLVAFRDIMKDEEIAIDYAMIVYDYRSEMTPENRVCHCGRLSCRGKLGSWKELPEEHRQKYQGYVSDYLQER